MSRIAPQEKAHNVKESAELELSMAQAKLEALQRQAEEARARLLSSWHEAARWASPPSSPPQLPVARMARKQCVLSRLAAVTLAAPGPSAVSLPAHRRRCSVWLLIWTQLRAAWLLIWTQLRTEVGLSPSWSDAN
jgi:hypothetical protein